MNMMKKLLFYLMFFVLFVSISCSQGASRSNTLGSQKNLLDSISKNDQKSIVESPKSVVARVKAMEKNDSSNSADNDTVKSSRVIGGRMSVSLVFINGKQSRDFPVKFREDGTVKELPIKEIKEILKIRNYIFDDVKILKDEKTLEEYQRKYGGLCDQIEIVYEIKAHPINQKGEIYEVEAHMPFFPGGEKALMAFIDQNIRYPKKMIQDSVHGRVVVYCIIEKDGSIEEFGIANNLLKDKSGNPCTDSAIKKQCEQEALRIVKMMPRWEPGKKENGEPVRVRYNIPVKFDSFSL